MTTPKDKLIQTYSLIITASTVAGATCSFIENFERSMCIKDRVLDLVCGGIAGFSLGLVSPIAFPLVGYEFYNSGKNV